jgi:LMBR1 domain-containing protein 1
MVFAGVGLVALPVDCIKAFVGRPRTTISRSEYVKRAQGLGNRAKQIKVPPPLLRPIHLVHESHPARKATDMWWVIV